MAKHEKEYQKELLKWALKYVNEYPEFDIEGYKREWNIKKVDIREDYIKRKIKEVFKRLEQEKYPNPTTKIIHEEDIMISKEDWDSIMIEFGV